MLTAKEVVSNAMSPNQFKSIWTGNYHKVLPLTLQDFDLHAILPLIFYMYRFGHRRGKGKFVETFKTTKSNTLVKRVSVKNVVDKITENDYFNSYKTNVEKNILCDLLLCYCFDNKNKSLDHDVQIQRIIPTHFFSSWVDLPERSAHLRYVPEMIVAMLSNQTSKKVESTNDTECTFPVSVQPKDNLLLSMFSKGVKLSEKAKVSGLSSDEFDDNVPVDVDELVAVRIATILGSAPERAAGKEDSFISNQRPIAQKATEDFIEDLQGFIRKYARVLPKQTFIDLLESCICVGLTTTVFSTALMLDEWSVTGKLSPIEEQQPVEHFIDCFSGLNEVTSNNSFKSFEANYKYIHKLPVILMALRLIDFEYKYTSKSAIDEEAQSYPYATDWINQLGSILRMDHPNASLVHAKLSSLANNMLPNLKEINPIAYNILDNIVVEPNSIWRLSEALTLLQGHQASHGNKSLFINSILLISQHNGLGIKRRKRTTSRADGVKSAEYRSLIFSDSVLDYLVHISLIHSKAAGKRKLSFSEFLSHIRNRYGFCIDVAPKHMDISTEVLHSNRNRLEARLRDLGLLIGVNDAESMKRINARFEDEEEAENGNY